MYWIHTSFYTSKTFYTKIFIAETVENEHYRLIAEQRCRQVKKKKMKKNRTKKQQKKK